MFKATPNPPDTDATSPNETSDSSAFDAAAKRALDYYLNPKPEEPAPGQLFTVVYGLDMECLLANLSETLASADAMISDLAFELEGSRRHVTLGIQQLIELAKLLANRALERVDPR
ncbi:DUF6124 family protein [Pseudomonas sp. SWRI154]|uniref:DUF6124 family protein n=1 Tax=Pseudomonas sp. SWRI154 TaxID=2745501 RepID=UPI001646ECB9|nr:DUF6124 family protein [Pseudomonas sp. SWRI154]MBC3364000.1 hypothetical protein [Pseudomonas sp. SWRI154]